jgi:uncharacterized phage protein gp47/JayE
MGAYAPPAITSAGLTVPGYQAIYNYYIAALQQIYGQSVVIDNSNPDVQLVSLFALAAADGFSALQLDFNNHSPNFAIGAALSSLVKLNGLQRKVATFSTVGVTLTGTPGTVITGGVVQDTVTGSRWDLPASVTVGGGGSVSVIATCETAGAVNIPIGTATIIATPTAGWTSVTNSAISTPGQPVEADSQLRTRQALSVAAPSETLLAGTLAAIAAVPNVTRYAIDENTGSTTNGNGTPGHSIQATVEGGAQAAIAQAIFANRGIGCGTFGDVTVAVTDPNTGITLNISFNQPPTYVPIYVIINAHLLPGGTSATLTAIAQAVAAYINSLQISGGGGVISFGELITAAASVNANPDEPVVSIRSPFYFGTSASPSTSTDVALAFGDAAQGAVGNITVNSV